jgi:hypothetical protein
MILSGCAGKSRTCVPPDLATAQQRIDLAARPGEYQPVDREELDALTARLRADDGPADPNQRKRHVLALSGGGKFGAYTAGVLNGWTAAGSRPAFDVVTGVSTGSLIATYAFLGPAYDAQLRCLYTTLDTRDVVRRRPKLAVVWSDAAYSSAPLARLIADEVDDRLLAEVATAHACGRRLFVGTTNLDARRLVIWDMGAIASGPRPDRLDLFRTVLLASCSVPGGMPPVPITVTVNGRRYTELHADGGATDGLFLRASLLGIDPAVVRAGRKPLVGSSLYIIIAGKLYADPGCVKPKLLDVAESAASSLTFSQTRGELIRLYMIALLGGMSFHLTALAQDVPVDPNSLAFEPAELRRLFDAGFCDGLAPDRWRTTPPGAEAGEQNLPRSGTDFLAPVTVPIGAGSVSDGCGVRR